MKLLADTRTALKYMVDVMIEGIANMLKDDGIDCRTVHECRRENCLRVNQMAESITTLGFVKLGFGAVREPFVENFKHRNELGAACCIYYRGEKVVDLRGGGIWNKTRGMPRDVGMINFCLHCVL